MAKNTYRSAQLIYPHQLFEEHYTFSKETLFILIEDDLFFRQYAFHKQKLLLHRLSMQAFKVSLEHKGFQTAYISSSRSITSMNALATVLQQHAIHQVSHYELVDDWLEKRLAQTFSSLHIKVSRINSPGFLTSRGLVDEYFDHNPNRMQSFYAWQRKRLNILIKEGQPVGGAWSFDQSNRKKLPKNIQLPPPYPITTSDDIEITKRWVEKEFPNNPGCMDDFRYPYTHINAKKWLEAFVAERLKQFGPYEDAISKTEPEIFHSVLSPLLNCGLLTPQEMLDAVMQSSDDIPIESLEGFVRQIIGWREYMRATYIRFGSKMRTTNYLKFESHLPKSWWDASVGIEPIDTVIRSVLKTGYAHHIERLMILGNFMVLTRVKPDDVYEWFMSLFIDAYDWVMVPNVYAMSQFAAGNLITTKPYVSGSNYIIKMSDYKKYNWSTVWDALYWQFVCDHRTVLENNYRSAMMVKLYDRFDDARKASIKDVAGRWL